LLEKAEKIRKLKKREKSSKSKTNKTPEQTNKLFLDINDFIVYKS